MSKENGVCYTNKNLDDYFIWKMADELTRKLLKIKGSVIYGEEDEDKLVDFRKQMHEELFWIIRHDEIPKVMELGNRLCGQPFIMDDIFNHYNVFIDEYQPSLFENMKFVYIGEEDENK